MPFTELEYEKIIKLLCDGAIYTDDCMKELEKDYYMYKERCSELEREIDRLRSVDTTPTPTEPEPEYVNDLPPFDLLLPGLHWLAKDNVSNKWNQFDKRPYIDPADVNDWAYNFAYGEKFAECFVSDGNPNGIPWDKSLHFIDFDNKTITKVE